MATLCDAQITHTDGIINYKLFSRYVPVFLISENRICWRRTAVRIKYFSRYCSLELFVDKVTSVWQNLFLPDVHT